MLGFFRVIFILAVFVALPAVGGAMLGDHIQGIFLAALGAIAGAILGLAIRLGYVANEGRSAADTGLGLVAFVIGGLAAAVLLIMGIVAVISGIT